MKRKNTVLFDFDGTIMDTNDVILKSWSHTFKTITGKDCEEKEIVRTFGEPLEITMERFFGGGPEKVAENIRIYRSYHIENYGKLISVFPGMEDLLKRLKEDDFKLALVTSRLRNTTYQGLEHYGLDKYFEYVVTADDTKVHKPDPAPINTALEKLCSSPDESVMVGDTKYDIQCAANAGVTSVLVDWSLALPESERVGENKPNHVIKEAMDLVGILRNA